MRLLASVLIVGSLVAYGCTSAGGGASPSPSAPSPSDSLLPGRSTVALDGRTFLSRSVQGHDLVPGTTVRLTFDGGRIGISAGCNQMGGSYTVVNDRLTLGQMMTTEMGCEPGLMAQDTWVVTFLTGASVALAGDTLTLTNGDVTMTLVDREVADPDRPLEGTKWVVDGIIAGEAVSSVPGGVTASIVIKSGQMLVDTGCNTGGATVSSTDAMLTIGPLALTKRGCAPPAASVEQAVVATLANQVRYTIEADSLTLSGEDSGLMLRAAP